jgi:ubiquinone/menaquinone biosynthesis C-methylase UbiE
MEFEKIHVQDIYNTISKHFSNTRGYGWPQVKDFLIKLPNNSLIGDIGCGNGKYNKYLDNNKFIIGCDFSSELAEIANKQNNMECIIANIIKLPYRDNTFDACINIAVLHHLSSNQRRLEALLEIIRITKKGGQILCCVWAFEKDSDNLQDRFVKWELQKKYGLQNTEEIPNTFGISGIERGNVFQRSTEISSKGGSCSGVDIRTTTLPLSTYHTYQRYYYMFKQNELENIIINTNMCTIEKSFYNHENWVCIFTKK